MKNRSAIFICPFLLFVLAGCGGASLPMVSSEESKDESDANVASLEYYPLDDGTYGVGVGRARYLSEIEIPERYHGRHISRIVSGGFPLNDQRLIVPKTITRVDIDGVTGSNVYIEYRGTYSQMLLACNNYIPYCLDVDGILACSDNTIVLGDGMSADSEEQSESGPVDPYDLRRGGSITYWCPNTDTDFFAEKVVEFKAAHPEFKGNIINLASLGEGDVRGELTKDPEVAADVFEIVDEDILACVTARAMTPFDSEDSSVMKSLYGAEAVKASSAKGKVYGVPYRNDNGYVLSYDTSIVSAEEAKTVEGIIAACKRAGATFNFNLTNSWYTFAPIWAAGGKTYTDDDGVFHSEIATEEIAKVAAGFAEIVRDAGTTWNHSDDDANFGASTGRVGAVVKWNNEAAQTQKLGDKLAITTLPSFTVGEKPYALKSFQGFKALGMKRAESFTDAKKITARAFCLFMGSDAVAKDRLTRLKQGVSNKAVIEQKDLWQSKWLAALSAQQGAGNTVSQANGCSNAFWSAAEALGKAIKDGTLVTKEAMLEALRICETVQNTPAN